MDTITETLSSSLSFSHRMRAARELLYGEKARRETAGATKTVELPRATIRADDVEKHIARLRRMREDLGVREEEEEEEEEEENDDNRHHRVVTADTVPVDNAATIVHRIDIMSYGIVCTWNLLRHVYMSFDTGTRESVEIHAGMSNYESSEVDSPTIPTTTAATTTTTTIPTTTASTTTTTTTTTTAPNHLQQLMYSTVNYYGEGRSEGYVLLCESCATWELDRAQRKNRLFFLPLNNCDTIVPFVYQTPLIWFSMLGLSIGIALSTQTFNVFVLALFVPVLAYVFTAVYNRTIRDERERRRCELRRCAHVATSVFPRSVVP